VKMKKDFSVTKEIESERETKDQTVKIKFL
jgi:hypothetical protein